MPVPLLRVAVLSYYRAVDVPTISSAPSALFRNEAPATSRLDSKEKGFRDKATLWTGLAAANTSSVALHAGKDFVHNMTVDYVKGNECFSSTRSRVQHMAKLVWLTYLAKLVELALWLYPNCLVYSSHSAPTAFILVS